MVGTAVTDLLMVEGLRVTYGGVVAVDDLDLDVPEGRVVGLIGPNGAGKTSAIDALTGYHRLSGGRVSFAGHEITRLRPHERARRGLTRTFQSVELFDDLTVAQNLMVAAETIPLRRAIHDLFLQAPAATYADVDWALAVCGLESVADHSPRDLSHGRRKLVGVARALAPRPRLVLLDEPAAGLDTDESVGLGRRLRSMPEEGVSVLLVDHDMGLVLSVCDDVYVLDFGKLIAHGPPSAICEDEAVVAAYLGGREVAHA